MVLPQVHGTIDWVASAKEDEQKFGFLDLPRELRDIIYEFAFCAEGAILIYADDPYVVRPVKKAMNIRHYRSGPIEPEPMLNKRLPVALVRTCRQLYAECSPVLYGSNTFAFDTSRNVEWGAVSGGAVSGLVRHATIPANPRNLFRKHLEEVRYWWKKQFWPHVLSTSHWMLAWFPNLKTFTITLNAPPDGLTQRPVFLDVVNKTREQRVALAATWMEPICSWEDDITHLAAWMKPRCSWEGEGLRRCLHLEFLPSPGSLRDQYAGTRFAPEDDEEWDVTEFSDAFQLMKKLT